MSGWKVILISLLVFVVSLLWLIREIKNSEPDDFKITSFQLSNNVQIFSGLIILMILSLIMLIRTLLGYEF